MAATFFHMHEPSPEYACHRCQAPHGADSRYCGRCGARLQAEATSAATDDTHQNLAAGEDIASIRPIAGRRAADRASRDPWLGQIVDARYRVVEMLGRGGMGAVYKVEHQRMGKIAAMKVLHSEYSHDAEVVERFHREAEAISRLTHPNTVQVFDFGTTRGALYLIMEYVRGHDLGSLLTRDGPLRFERAAPIFMQICAALGEAHSLGIVHRDLKPENVLVTRTHRGRDFAKVLDFGLAKLGEAERPDVSSHDAIIGTPYYMSPEQIRGDHVDARSDIYSMGALMYRILTGQPAFTAKTPVGVLTQHLTAELIPPSERMPALHIHPSVNELVMRAMAKKPEGRYAGIGELLDELESTFMEIVEQSLPRGLLELTSWTGKTSEQARPTGQSQLEDSHDGVDYGIHSGVRLQRADLDVFEASLKRRRRMRIALVPLLLGAIAASIAYMVIVRPATPRRSEKEPNNELDQATLIAPRTGVSGYLGRRIDKHIPDRDYYRVTGSQPGDMATVHVSALPNIDIEISIFDATGKLLSRVDEGGMDDPEWIRQVRITGPLYVMVTESMAAQARLPTENVSDAYTLEVTIEPTEPGRESEPNDVLGDALEATLGQAMTGYLDRRSDIDVYRFSGQSGSYTLAIEAAADLPLLWELGTGVPSGEQRASVELSPGAIIRIMRSDRTLPPGQLPPGSELPYRLTITGK